MVAKRRVYKKGAKNSEYDAYHGTSEQKKRRAQRNKDRRKKLASGAVKKGDGKEVHHPNAKRKGKSLGKKTRVVSKATNRKKQPKRS